MSKLINEFEFELTQAIPFHNGGELAHSKKLLLKAPANIHRINTTKLKQGFMKAIMGMQNKKSSSKVKEAESNDSGFDAKVILMLLLASDIDFCEYIDHFKNLICSDPSLCLVNGNIALNKHMFDQINPDDCEMLLGKYIENFTLSSWMNLLGLK